MIHQNGLVLEVISSSAWINDSLHSLLEIAARPCCRRTAKNTVEVSDDINELIIGVRNYLQETCEPPCYVSDRRLLKAVDMLKARLCLGH